MRAPRSIVAGLLVGVLAVSGCHDEKGTPGAGQSGQANGAAAGEVSAGPAVPRFDGRLRLLVTTALQVYGNGCRQLNARQLCNTDGSKTYMVMGALAPVTLTRVRMHLDATHGAWVVVLRFARGGRRDLRESANHARGMGGDTLVVVPHSEDVLTEVGPEQVADRRITLAGLDKPVAWSLVQAYVTEATKR